MGAVEDRLAEIEARAGAATAGPWDYCHPGQALGGPSVAVLDDYYVISLTTRPNIDTWEDAAFIAHVRTDVPALAAALRAVLAAVATFESLVRDDIGDAGIPAWGDGYLRGYHDAATDIREVVAAALVVTP